MVTKIRVCLLLALTCSGSLFADDFAVKVNDNSYISIAPHDQRLVSKVRLGNSPMPKETLRRLDVAS